MVGDLVSLMKDDMGVATEREVMARVIAGNWPRELRHEVENPDWRYSVPCEVRDIWSDLTAEAMIVACFMACCYKTWSDVSEEETR